MKTSYYIIMAWAAFILGSMLCLFVFDKQHKGTNYISKEYPVPGFSVLVAEPEAVFSIEQGEQNRVIVSYPDREQEPAQPYRISNDTLYVSAKNHTRNNVSFTRLSSLVLQSKSDVRLSNFDLDSLSVCIDDAFIYMDNRPDHGKNNIKSRLFVSAKNATVNIHNLGIVYFTLRSNASTIRMFVTEIDQLSAKLENETDFYMNFNVEKMEVEKDKGSKIEMHP